MNKKWYDPRQFIVVVAEVMGISDEFVRSIMQKNWDLNSKKIEVSDEDLSQLVSCINSYGGKMEYIPTSVQAIREWFRYDKGLHTYNSLVQGIKVTLEELEILRTARRRFAVFKK